MSALPKKLLTESEYLAIERGAEFKSEYVNGEMFPLHEPGPRGMAGARYAHNRIKENLVLAIGGRLLDGPCQTLSSDMKVKVPPSGPYYYPDVLIVCDEPEFLDSDSTDVLLNPAVVFEVLSDSTEGYDRGFKFRQYQKIPTLKELVLVAQDEMVCERFVRQVDDTWLLTTFDKPNGEFSLSTLSVRVPMAEIYRGVVLPASPSR